MENLKTMLKAYCKGDRGAGYAICANSGSIHALEEFLGAENSMDLGGMDAAVNCALRALGSHYHVK